MPKVANEKLKNISFQAPPKVHEALRKIARLQNRTPGVLIRMIVENAIPALESTPK